MKIEINNNKRLIDVPEPYLEVKGNGLYNNKEKRYEGLDGDLAIFIATHEDGKRYEHRGTIDGYTCGGRIKFRGSDQVFHNIKDIRITHISVITKCETDVVEYSLVFA